VKENKMNTTIYNISQEWQKIGKGRYVNKKSPFIFKNKEGIFNIVALLFFDDEYMYTEIELNNKIKLKSRIYISRFPIIPKTFKIKVKRLKNGTFKIIDINKLIEAFIYYGQEYNLEEEKV